MIDYKNWNLKHLGHMVVLSIILILVIGMIHLFVSPLLTTLFPAVFTTALTLTDTILFLILLKLVVRT